MSRQRGSIPVELAAAVGLLLIPTALLVLSFGPWLERRTLVRTAAAEAARLEVVSDGDEEAVARLVAAWAGRNGLDAGGLQLALCGGAATPADRPLLSTCLPLRRGEIVAVEVRTVVPLVRTPFGDVGGVTVTATAIEMVDRHRSLP
ncbi:MAG: hypothetical protein R6X29_08630 [Acidimicrobiia bacterium]|jgi:hypothetical protein